LDKRLEGTWVSDMQDKATRDNIGDVKMIFTSDGKLVYEINTGNTLQKINMIWWTEGDTLFTDQPSHPRQESTKYTFENDNNTLVLEFEGEKTRFKRKV
jgi:hypothetical protein